MNENSANMGKPAAAHSPASAAAEAEQKPEVQDETAKRASGLYTLIDSKNWMNTSSEQVVYNAMANGASTAEEFAKAFRDAGVKSEATAKAIGETLESHFLVASHEIADAEQAKLQVEAKEQKLAAGHRQETNNMTHKKPIFPLSRRLIEWLLLAGLAVSLLVAPWRTSTRSKETLGYSVLFVAPDKWAEIDLSRYAVQVFAVTAICGIVYVKTRREPASR